MESPLAADMPAGKRLRAGELGDKLGFQTQEARCFVQREHLRDSGCKRTNRLLTGFSSGHRNERRSE